jgi:hypothetical protein
MFSWTPINPDKESYTIRINSRGLVLDEDRSCPRAWCKSGVAFALSGGFSRCCQAAAAGSLKIGSSLNGAIVSSVM